MKRERHPFLKAILRYTSVILFLLVSHIVTGQKTVTGRVSSGDTATLGATVLVKGTTVATKTGDDGSFSITVPAGSNTLVITSIGYEQQEVAIGSSTSLTINLRSLSTNLNEVVVVGYGTQKRKDLTGAVSSISAETIAKVPVNTIDQSLQGRAAGVQVTNNDGRPGSGVSVQIRGVGSLAAYGNEPLYVVDGYPITGGLNNINPSDVASIDVLKDASATAIYGVRAANGVVIITTKKGRRDGLQVSLDAYNFVQSEPKKYHVLNAQEFSALVKEVTADPTQGSFTPLPEWATPASLNSVDWQEALYRNGLKQNYNLAVRGGNEKVQTAFSVGYNDQKGIVKGSYFKRLNLSLNTDYTIAKWLKSTTSIKYSRQDQNTPLGSGGLQQLTELIPTITGNRLTNEIKDANGNYGFYNPVNTYTRSWGNPLYTIENNDYKNLNNYFLANTSLEATLVKGLRIKTNVGANISDYSGYYFQPQDERSSIQYNLSGANQDAFYSQSANNTFEWLWENTITYAKTFGKHSLDFLGGISAQKNTYRYINGSGNRQISNLLRDLSQVNNLTASGSQTTYSLASEFGRINYNFNSRYYLTGTVRRDGVSKFAPGHEYGTFPSASASWRIKEESFMQSVSWLQDLKLRGGWGAVGNQSSIALFQYQGLYSSGGVATSGNNYGYQFNKIYQAGLAPFQPSNPELKWETDYQTNLGLDASLLKGALTVTVDYYIRKSKDFLLNLPVPSQTGFSQNLAQNVGEIENKGLELALTYNSTPRKDFTYSAALTFTTVNNKLLSIKRNVNFIENLVTVSGLNAGGWATFSRTNVGQSIGEFYGYRSLGIFQSKAQIDALNAAALSKNPSTPFYQKNTTAPGDRYFADVNGDGHVDASDRTSLGSPLPKFFGGLNLDANYKRFDVNVYFYGSYGNKIFNYQARMLESFQAPGFVGVENIGYEYFKNHWTPSNPSNRYTRFTYNDDVIASNVPSSQYVEDGSFTRLKNLTIGYTLPAHLMGNISIPRIRLYVSGQNLFTITKYSGLDPEIGVAGGSATASGIDSGIYPNSRTYTLGFNVIF